MKNTVKLFALSLLQLSILMIMASCLYGGSSDMQGGNSGQGNTDQGGGDFMGNSKTHYYASSEIMFLSADDASCEDAAYKLLTAFDKHIISNDGYVFSGFISEKRNNEVLVGYIPEREVSLRAYEKLNDVKSSSGITESRYLIYAEDGTIAVAYDRNPYTAAEAIGDIIDLFIEKYVNGKKEISFVNGVVMSGTMNLIDIQKRIDEEKDEKRWEAVRDKIGDEDIYLAFRSFFDQCFNDEIVELIASYYDPATGLFYASASGKRADGIYPIPEATSSALSYVLNTGMLNGMGSLYLLPDLARHKIIYYLKSIQAEDGEFYVSQMKKAEIDSNRIGRDRGACLGLFERLGATPTYSVGSWVGDGIDAEEYWAGLVSEGIATEEDKPIIYWAENRAERARSFAESVASAVSRVVPASSGTEQFQSHESFIKWLLAKDPYNNPYTAISNTSSAASLISDWSKRLGEYSGGDTVVTYGAKSFELYRGDTLNEILIRWMNGYINSAGLFGKVTNATDSDGNPIYDGFYGGWGYQNSNGFLKAIGRYSDMGIPYPEPRLAIESLLKGINSDEPMTGTILVIFNVWSSLNNLKNNISKYYVGDDKEELLSMIDDGLKKQIVIDEATGETKAYGAIAIEKCTDKILQYKKSDGGFGHAVDYSTSTWQGGLKVAVASDNLSDMDAIACSTTYLGNAMAVLFGLNFLQDVPMNNNADLLLFLETMQKQEYVVKDVIDGGIISN